jgi:hypothetical protein
VGLVARLRAQAALATGLAGFLGREFMSRTLGVGGLSTFATGFARFLSGKLMRSPFRMRGPTAQGGNRALFGSVHACKSA